MRCCPRALSLQHVLLAASKAEAPPAVFYSHPYLHHRTAHVYFPPGSAEAWAWAEALGYVWTTSPVGL